MMIRLVLPFTKTKKQSAVRLCYEKDEEANKQNLQKKKAHRCIGIVGKICKYLNFIYKIAYLYVECLLKYGL